MENDIYQKLAQHLDNLPGGFPATESGVELRILRRLFTPEEAQLTLHLTLIPEEARVVARRAKIGIDEAGRRLEEMARKGLIFSVELEGGVRQYMVSQLVIGIWEFHVNDLDEEFVRDMDEYLPTLFKEAWKTPQMRTIPINRSITPDLEVMTYERAEELVREQEKIVVAPCICRRERTITGDGCNAPEETCLSFGMAADYYQRNGLGRVISQNETLEILEKAEEAGLVLQPGNAEKAMFICCCCGCCCGVLRTAKKFPKPASMLSSPFKAVVNTDTCETCGTCVDRCQMEALSLDYDSAILDEERCIGCGLCVATCPSGSLSLVRKSEAEQPRIPKNHTQTSIKLAQSRGKLKATELVMMQVKSKVDRLLARR